MVITTPDSIIKKADFGYMLRQKLLGTLNTGYLCFPEISDNFNFPINVTEMKGWVRVRKNR